MTIPALQTFTTDYVPGEDRIRLSGRDGAGQVHVIWLTCRLSGLLIRTLCSKLEAETGGAPVLPRGETPASGTRMAGLLQEFAQEQAMAALEPSARVEPGPVFSAGLALEVDISPSETGLVLVFKCAAAPAARTAWHRPEAQSLRAPEKAQARRQEKQPPPAVASVMKIETDARPILDLDLDLGLDLKMDLGPELGPQLGPGLGHGLGDPLAPPSACLPAGNKTSREGGPDAQSGAAASQDAAAPAAALALGWRELRQWLAILHKTFAAAGWPLEPFPDWIGDGGPQTALQRPAGALFH